MCELLVRVVDKVNKDSPELDAQCLKRGDVVVVCPDGWGWSQMERSNPDWRIVRVPGMTVEEAQTLLSPQVGDRKTNPLLKRRALGLDLDAAGAPAALKAVLSDRGEETKRTVPKAAITALTKLREVASVDVIG